MGPNFDINKVKWLQGSHGLPTAYYKLDIPSVTGIINTMVPDPEMEEWIRKEGKEKVDEIMRLAGYRGTALHIFLQNFIENFSKTKDISEALKVTQTKSPEILEKENIPKNKIEEGRNLFYKFYYSEYPSQYSDVIGTELGIYSPTLFYRGKLDIFYLNKIFGYTVTDFKTSSDYIKKGSVKEYKYFLQLGAYSNCIDEMYKEKVNIKRASILCINTKLDKLQEIICVGKQLQEYKEKFKTMTKNFHIKNNQKYLII